MSRQFRYRATGIALAALFAVAPLLTTESAHAEQAGGARQVVFGGGGVLGLSCAARPNVEAMRVPAGTTLRVVNRTGHRAKLRLNGASQGQLADDGATEVVFRRGTVAVMMEPDCALREASTPAVVTASPSVDAPSSTPQAPPISAPPTSDSAAPPSPSDPTSPAATATSTSASSGGSPSLPGSPAGPVRPSGASTATRHGASATSTTATSTSMPQGGTTTQVVTGTTAVGTSAATSTSAGMPPGDDPSAVSGVPSVDALPPTDLASAATSAASAETVAALEPISGTGQDGLLAAIATICVLGVGAGAIRAFVAQRASRTSMA